MTEAKKRGRPKTETSRQVCEALLGAAENCLRTKTYKAITVREIAALADTNPAMINYYFNNKEGLFVALIDFLFTQWEDGIRRLVDDMPNHAESPTKALVQLIDACFYQHAPIIKLLTHELAARNSGIREIYRNRLSSRITKSMRQFLVQAGKLGFYRTDLHLNYTVLNLSSMAIHPMSIPPRAMLSAYGIESTEFQGEAWLNNLEQDINRLCAVAPG